MPVCTSCKKTTRYKSRYGILCKDCSNAASELNNDDESDLSHNELLVNKDKQLSELTVGDLLKVINEAISPINKKLEGIEFNLNNIRADVKNNETEIKQLKNVIIEQQKAIDSFHRDKRDKNLILSGVKYQHGEILVNKISFIFAKMSLNYDIQQKIEDIYRLGSKPDDTENDYRQIMIKFKTNKDKYEILRCSKLLKNWRDDKDTSLGTRNIYINPDESPMTRKENARLRKERDRLRNLDENAGKKIVIHKGKLKVDNIVHDELNIENQLFDGKNF